MKRATQQRDAIRNAIYNAGRPLSVNEIFRSARNEVTNLGIATVYRNLKVLQEEKQIVQVDLPGEPPRWETTHSSHHHHFLCRTCDRLFEINNCLADITRLLPSGYTLEEHDILLRGQCDFCVKKSELSAKKK